MNSSSSNSITTTPGPLPTKHIFLHELYKQHAGSKVRFLACVSSYDISTGFLVLEHAFPLDAPHIARTRVDIRLILESVKADELQNGAWLNVIGYVDTPAPTKAGRRRRRRKDRAPASAALAEQTEGSTVQAMLLWSAGAVRIGEYEQILLRQHELARQFHASS